MTYPTTDSPVVPIRHEIRGLLRERLLEAVAILLEEELTAGLGVGRYERSESRRGSRNGTVTREITTEVGPLEIGVPRGRLVAPDGSTTEFQSNILPRYARRTRKVDEAILGAYLAGANTRRIRKALAPLLGEVNLSKSAVSRVVTRLKGMFERWSARELSEERYAIVYLDAIHIKVRLAKRVVSVPVLVVLGVEEETGQKRIVAMRLAASESAAAWGDLVADLERRGMPEPALVVSDGHPGLTKAIKIWDGAQVQRCVHHKLQNLLAHCPKHARAEVKRDYDRIVHAKNGLAARQARDEFLAKWSKHCPPVARSLEEAGDNLLTFYDLPRAMWKSIRTTNSIENLNREFRRRTKTQASFSNEAAALTLLFGLIAFEQIRLRRIDGFRHLPKIVSTKNENAA